ncbi:MAG: hypothetical protein JXA71_17945 [Chitinispirillaceae bacterium]|nr:hypothetical protein [Chitinispirillaceae bacterium]
MIRNHPVVAVAVGMLVASGVFSMAAAAASAYQGYMFCASGQNAYLINPSGTTVHTWKATSSARSYALLLPDGSALFPISTSCTVRGDGAYPHGRLQKVSWENQVVWDAVVCDATFTPGYTLEPMPNGNILVAGASNTGGLKIAEIQPSGTSGKAVPNPWEFNLPDSLGRTGYINSISYNPELDYIGIDINQAKKLVVINKATKAIVYTYQVTTGVATHGARWVTKYHLSTATVIPDANLTAMRTNNFLVVNNSLQVVEVNPVAKMFVKTIPFAFTAHEGSVQRLPNGNTLVNAANSRAVELSDNGTTVRTITLPGTVARAYMYAPSYSGLRTYATGTVTPAITSSSPGFTFNSAANSGAVTAGGQVGSPLSVRIFSMDGRTVYAANARSGSVRFSTKTFCPGVYQVDARHASGSLRATFVKM